MQQNSLIKKIDNQFQYTLRNSGFYNEKFHKIGFDKISDITQFLQIPFSNKEELLENQKQHPPFGNNLCVEDYKILRIHKTSGTINKPYLICLTEYDIKRTIENGAKCFSLSGLNSNHTVIHCLSYNMWTGGFTDHQSLEKTGAAVIPFGVGNTNFLIETLLNIKPSAIHCTPSYLSKIELVLKNDHNLNPIDLNLKLGLFGAESGLQNQNFRSNIEEKWGLKAMNANYGMADVLSIFGAECSLQKGLHFIANDLLHPELIDSDTLNVLPIEKGVIGELVLTNLDKECQPLLRYRTKDVIEIIETSPCECGCTGFIFRIIGRSDDMITIKGVNIFINSIETIITNHLKIFSGTYQIHINKTSPIDKMQIIIEKKDTILLDDSFINEIKQKFKTKLSILPNIIFVEEGHLPRTEQKAKKIYKDL